MTTTRIDIRTCTKIFDEFSAEAKRLKLSYAKLFEKLWQVYKSASLDTSGMRLSLEEQQAVNEAIAIAGCSSEELLRSALLKKAKAILQEGIHIPDPPEDWGEVKRRIWFAINKILYWNTYCKPEDRVYPTISVLQRIHGANFAQTSEVLAFRAEEIERHCALYKISKEGNRKGSDSEGKKIKLEELIGSYPPPQLEVIQKMDNFQAIPETTEAIPSVEAEVVPTEEGDGNGDRTTLTPKQYFELLKDEPNPSAHAKASKDLLSALREKLDVRIITDSQGHLSNEGIGEVSKLDTKLEAYRKLFRGYPLTPETMSFRNLKNARLPSSYPGGKPPEGSRLNSEGLVIAEPRHLAISYLVLSDIENAFMNLSRSPEYAEQYPQFDILPALLR